MTATLISSMSILQSSSDAPLEIKYPNKNVSGVPLCACSGLICRSQTLDRKLVARSSVTPDHVMGFVSSGQFIHLFVSIKI